MKVRFCESANFKIFNEIKVVVLAIVLFKIMIPAFTLKANVFMFLTFYVSGNYQLPFSFQQPHQLPDWQFYFSAIHR
jgi:hypothetical protein